MTPILRQEFPPSAFPPPVPMKIVILQDYLRSGGTGAPVDPAWRGICGGRPRHHARRRFGPAGPGSDDEIDRAASPAIVRSGPGLVCTRTPPDRPQTGSRDRSRNGSNGELPVRASLQRLCLDRQNPRGAVVGTLRTGKPLLLALSRRSLQTDRHIIANSEDARCDPGRAGRACPPDKITVIRNSLVFPARAAAPSSGLRERMGAGAETTVLLCVAMFRPEKNQRELVEIAAGLPPDRIGRGRRLAALARPAMARPGRLAPASPANAASPIG